MSIICDHPGCGATARRRTLKFETWNTIPTFETDDIEVTFSEFSADLCDDHADQLLIFVGARMTERDDG
ncbi:hypothetical protein [Pseudooceanicola nanhaiensis]|uniref:hypothetical protein n=1 Tax=Pseudooceanicola nanhaiensis TaxID=375761 RepID=UPI003510EB14